MIGISILFIKGDVDKGTIAFFHTSKHRINKVACPLFHTFYLKNQDWRITSFSHFNYHFFLFCSIEYYFEKKKRFVPVYFLLLIKVLCYSKY